MIGSDSGWVETSCRSRTPPHSADLGACLAERNFRVLQGDWRGISRQFVQTRSPTQVASHAQKYFIRQSVVGKRKRRSSLFDLVPDGSQVLTFIIRVAGLVQITSMLREAAQLRSLCAGYVSRMTHHFAYLMMLGQWYLLKKTTH